MLYDDRTHKNSYGSHSWQCSMNDMGELRIYAEGGQQNKRWNTFTENYIRLRLLKMAYVALTCSGVETAN